MTCVCLISILEAEESEPVKSNHTDNCIVCVMVTPHWAEIWENHLQPLKSLFSPLVKSCRLKVQLGWRGNRATATEEERGATASRVSPRIMDWAAASLIVRLQEFVCMQMHACLNLCVRVQCEKQDLHIINAKLANYNCVTVSFRSTLCLSEEYKKGTSAPSPLSCNPPVFKFASHNY